MDLTKKKRIIELDYIKGLCIIGMIVVHCYESLYYGDGSAVSYIYLNVLNTSIGATAFMFCMGFGTKLTRKDGADDYLIRGVMLFTIGITLNIFREIIPVFIFDMLIPDSDFRISYAIVFGVDILEFAGLAFILLGILKKLRLETKGILVVAVIMSIFGTFVQDVTVGSYAGDTLLAFFVGSHAESYFPLCNWFIFVAAGRFFAEYYKTLDNCTAFWKKATPIFLILAAAYLYAAYKGVPIFRNLGKELDFCWMYTSDAIGSLCCIMLYMGLMHFVANLVYIRPLCYMSEHINNIYITQWVIIMPICVIMEIGLLPWIESSPMIVGVAFIIILASVFFTWLYLNYFATALRAFFGKRKYMWMAIIWIVAIIAFTYSVTGDFQEYPCIYNNYME